jgi:hypothetical protein
MCTDLDEPFLMLHAPVRLGGGSVDDVLVEKGHT